MKKYQLHPAVHFNINEGTFEILHGETGFSGRGNLDAYAVLHAFITPHTENEVVALVAENYPEEQMGRIVKSTPKIIDWALERNILLGIDSTL